MIANTKCCRLSLRESMAFRGAKGDSRRGLTLLELILAMALSVFVLMAIGMAIDLHYRMLDVRRTNVEESRVARQSLKMIADDLKSAVQFVPPDLSGLDAVSANTAASLNAALASAGDELGGLGGTGGTGGADRGQSGDGQTGSDNTPMEGGSSGQSGQSGGASGASGGGTSGSGTSATGTSATGASRSTTGGQLGSVSGLDGESTASTSAATSVVGLYGTMNELRFDISRLPRVDQYQSLMADGDLSATDIPSDIKTVVYFVQEEGSLGSPAPTSTGVGRGLMRAELDRAVSAWAEMNGDTTSAYNSAKLLAEEVTAIEFQYFDGATWTQEWNSDEMGGLPVAVEIFLTLQPTRAMTEEEIAALSYGSEEQPEPQTYRLVVRLPTAVSAETRALELEAEETAAAELLPSEPSGTQTAGSGNSGGTGGGNSGGVGSGGTGGGDLGSGGGREGRGGGGDSDGGGGRRGRRGGGGGGGGGGGNRRGK